MRRIVPWFVAMLVGARMSNPALADEPKPLERIKQHEQEFEKKVETERDRPDKKKRVKEVVDRAEKNIRELGEQIKGAGHEVGAAAKRGRGSDANNGDGGNAAAAPPPRAKGPRKTAGQAPRRAPDNGPADGATAASQDAARTPAPAR